MADTDVPAGPGEDNNDDGGASPSWWRRWWVWATAAAVVLVTVGVIVWAVQGDDKAEDTAPTTTATTSTTTTTTSTTTTTTSTTTTTTAPPQALTLDALAEQIVTLVPANLNDPAWECRAETSGPLTAGSVVICGGLPVPSEGERHLVTVLVLDDAGTYAATRSGLDVLLLNPGAVGPDFVPAGLNCTNLLAPDSAFIEAAQRGRLTPEQTYFGVVMYYFFEGRSPLMDIDNNGIPCETLIEFSVVDTVWGGGWIASPLD